MEGTLAQSKADSTRRNLGHVPRSGVVSANGQERYYEIHGAGPHSSW